MAAAEKTEKASGAWTRLRWARRVTQSVFLLLFLFLILATTALTGAGIDAATSGSVPYPVEAFLDIDPLIGLIVALSTGTVPGALIFGLVVLGSAAFLGRGFCGWICPMGTMNHVVGQIRQARHGQARIDRNSPRPYAKIKYAILVGVLVAALFGSAIGGLFDPISLATRGVSLTLLPWLNWVIGGAIDFFAESNVPALQHVSDATYDAVDGVVVYQRGFLVGGGTLISVLFIVVLAANRWIPRFWCRSLCPLGALLGVSGRFGALALHKDHDLCNQCGKCQLDCSGAAAPRPGDRWQRAECDLCMNCVTVCDQGALSFRLAGEKSDEQAFPDLRRRTVIAGAVIGAAAIPAMRTGALGSVEGRPDPARIRPPGAVDEKEFIERCVRCGQCMKICPNNALHPALDEAGIEGLWTPVLVPATGYCEPTCTLCSQVCPTGAIRRVTEDQKIGKNGARMVSIGTAFFDRGRCLPWAMGTPCTVCEEFCPTSPKAIWMKEEEVEVLGRRVNLKVPYLDPSQCNGCGACEYVCPVHDKAAVRVTCSGESRSRDNQLLLTPSRPSPARGRGR